MSTALAMTWEKTSRSDQFMLWIDGVGAWLICTGDRITIGGPCLDQRSADICLLGHLSRKHVSMIHRGDRFFAKPHAPTSVSGRYLQQESLLVNNSEITMDNSVRLRFRQPTPLSTTAVLDFVSDHRPAYSVDGIVLMQENCLLGPGSKNHVRCRDWSATVVIFQQSGRLWCRSSSEFSIDGRIVRSSGQIGEGAVIEGEDFCFRLESVPRPD